MTNTDIFTLIEQIRNELAKLQNQVAKDNDPKRRAESADASMNAVAMFVLAENAVIYPTVQAKMPAAQAAGKLRDACIRLRQITHDLGLLEQTSVEANEFSTYFETLLTHFSTHYSASHALIKELCGQLDTAAVNELTSRWTRVCENAPRRALGGSLTGDKNAVAPAGDVGQKAGSAANPVSLSQRLDRAVDETELLSKRMAQEEDKLQQSSSDNDNNANKVFPTGETSHRQQTSEHTSEAQAQAQSAGKVFPTGESLGTATTIGVQGPKALAKQEMEQAGEL